MATRQLKNGVTSRRGNIPNADIAANHSEEISDKNIPHNMHMQLDNSLQGLQDCTYKVIVYSSGITKGMVYNVSRSVPKIRVPSDLPDAPKVAAIQNNTSCETSKSPRREKRINSELMEPRRNKTLLSVPRYIRELHPEHFSSSDMTLANINFIKKKFADKDNEIRRLKQERRRLVAKLMSL